MTFSGELAVWLVFCSAGLITASLAFRYAHLIHRAAVFRDAHPDIVSGTRHLRATELERVIGWFGFTVAGLLATIDPVPERPIGVTFVGQLIRWGLISTVGLWSFKTVSDYLYARAQWQKRGE